MVAPYDKEHYRPVDTFAYEALTVSGSAVSLTVATHTPGGATGNTPALVASVSIEGGQVRYRLDGTDPTTSVGTLLNDADELIVWGRSDLLSIRFIAAAGNVTANIHYGR